MNFKIQIAVFFILISSKISFGIIFPQFSKKDSILKVAERQYSDQFLHIDYDTPERDNWLKEQEKYFNNYFKGFEVFGTNERLHNLNSYKNNNFILLGNKFYRILYDRDGVGIFSSNNSDIDKLSLLIGNDDIIKEKGKFASIRNLSVSRNNEFLAYSYSINGTENLMCRVFNIKEHVHLLDTITNIDDDNLQWYNEGFFYKAFKNGKIMYHSLFTNSKKDTIFFSNSSSSTNSFFVINNESYLIIEQHNLKTKLFNYYFINLNLKNQFFKPLILKNESQIEFVSTSDSLIYFLTNTDDTSRKLFFVDPKIPTKWNTSLMVKKDEQLESVKIFSNFIIASVVKGPRSYLMTYPKIGNQIEAIKIDLGFYITDIQGTDNENIIYFNLGSLICPDMTFEYNLNTKKYHPIGDYKLNFEIKNYELIYKEAPSHDGKKIPLLLAKRKNIKLENLPILLETYGGYGISSQNTFRPDILDFIDKNGLYVKAFIRGGGELGDEWHKQGSGINKSNTIRDFVSCAKFLIDSNFTSQKKLAIRGGSHGGFVVGAAYSLYPNLFKAAIATAAPLDLIELLKDKKSLFQFNEYGNIYKKNELDSIEKFNPYTNIKDSINYPSLYVYTSENDERVNWTNPAKFVIKLQNRPVQKSPILFNFEKGSGHFGNEKNYDKIIENLARQNKFLFKELEMDK